jgi:hypothetical protein
LPAIINSAISTSPETLNQEIGKYILDDLENLEVLIVAENICVSDIRAPLEEIRGGLKNYFENYENVN